MFFAVVLQAGCCQNIIQVKLVRVCMLSVTACIEVDHHLQGMNIQGSPRQGNCLVCAFIIAVTTNKIFV